MLVYESDSENNGMCTESRVYFDTDTTDTNDIIFYQYLCKDDKVLDMNCIHIQIKHLSLITKQVLKSYISTKIL